MNLPMFSPKDDLHYDIAEKIKLISFGSPKTGNWGQYWPDATCEYKGKTHGWNISDKTMAKLKEDGFKEGDTFYVKKVKTKKGFDFIQFLPEGDNQTLAQNQPNPGEPEVIRIKDYGTQVGRGASLNLAAYYSIYKVSGGSLPITEWFKDVQNNATQLVEAQKAFVNS